MSEQTIVNDSIHDDGEQELRMHQVITDGSNYVGQSINVSDYTQMSANPRPKKRDGLRRGKWTVSNDCSLISNIPNNIFLFHQPEEEKYTNKVIETFNAGILQLPENELGITLRAYLADKLCCDPMRITKKYTGASCLGKRVYHGGNTQVNPELVANAQMELQILERNFLLRLEQNNRKKANDAGNSLEQRHMISTPGIDALLHQGRPAPQQQQQLHQHQQLSHPWHNPSSMFVAPSGALPTYGSHPHPLVNQRPVMGVMSVENKLMHPTSDLVYKPMLLQPIVSSSTAHGERMCPRNEIKGPGIPFGYQPPVNNNNNDVNAPLNFKIYPVVNNQDLDRCTNETELNYQMRSISASQAPKDPSVGSSSASNTDRLVSDQVAPDTVSEEELKKSLIQSELDYNVAASSLLGFMNHLQKIGSQEDLVEFFEGVQKTASISPSVNNGDTNAQRLTNKMKSRSSENLIRLTNQMDTIPRSPSGLLLQS